MILKIPSALYLTLYAEGAPFQTIRPTLQKYGFKLSTIIRNECLA
jgi:hypothetical protein